MLSSSSSGSEAGVRCSEPGSLTGQNAEPVGMKLTLFLSGQEKSGADVAGVDCLELRRNICGVRQDRSKGSREAFHMQHRRQKKKSVPHFFKRFNLLAALWRLALEHVAVVGFGRRRKLGQW